MSSLTLKILGGTLVALIVGVIASMGSAGSTTAATCNEGTDTGGRLAPGDSAMFEATFCSDPTDSLVGWVNWGKKINSDRDLAVLVTSPSGTTFYFDDGPSSTQSFIIYGPLEEGDWTVEVINVGTKRVKYDLQLVFG